MESTGLRKSDPRLKEMVTNIEKYQKNCEYTRDIKELVIGRKQFKTWANNIKGADLGTVFCMVAPKTLPKIAQTFLIVLVLAFCVAYKHVKKL